MSDFGGRVLAWLRDHPHSTARDVARGIGIPGNARGVFMLLQAAQAHGKVTRSREGVKAWHWEVAAADGGAETRGG